MEFFQKKLILTTVKDSFLTLQPQTYAKKTLHLCREQSNRMGDTVFCVLNLPRATDPEDAVRYADSVVMQRIRRVYGRCTAFYTVEHGNEGTHPHMSILYQFRQAVDKDRIIISNTSFCNNPY